MYVCARVQIPTIVVTIMAKVNEKGVVGGFGFPFLDRRLMLRGAQLQRSACTPSADHVVEEFPCRLRLGLLAGKVRAPVVV